MNIYYIYAYIRSKDSNTAPAGTPYYIGKGKDNRAFYQHKKSDHTGVSTPSDRSKIIILETNLTEIGAFALERRLIRWWGRKDLRTGILNNKTDGGDGTSGALQSDSAKKKISESQKKRIRRPLSEETKLKISIGGRGLTRSAVTCAKISEANKGKSKSATMKKKLSESTLGRLKGPHSEETKEKIRESKKYISEETREKMRISALNRKKHEKFGEKCNECN